MQITREWAEWILEMERICWNEGIGPPVGPLMLAIREQWPDLAARFEWLPWDRYEKGTRGE
jgi:hypothetical protein